MKKEVKPMMGDNTLHSTMSRSMGAAAAVAAAASPAAAAAAAGTTRKNNCEEVAKRRAALQHQLEQRREEARRQQEERMAKAAAQKEEAVLAKAHASASRLSQQKARPVFAFGSSTPRELGYLTQLTKEQKVYDRKLQPETPPPQPAISASRMATLIVQNGRAHGNTSSISPNSLTKSLYVAHPESKSRSRFVQDTMTQSMVATSKGPSHRASNKSPVAASSTTQRAVATQRHPKTPQQSSSVSPKMNNNNRMASASRKSPQPVMTRPQKTAVRQNKKNVEMPKNVVDSKEKVDTSGEVSESGIKNNNAQNEVVKVSNKQEQEQDDVEEGSKKEAEVIETVEVVHDSPSTENAHVNVLQGAVTNAIVDNVIEICSESEAAQQRVEQKSDNDNEQHVNEKSNVEWSIDDEQSDSAGKEKAENGEEYMKQKQPSNDNKDSSNVDDDDDVCAERQTNAIKKSSSRHITTVQAISDEKKMKEEEVMQQEVAHEHEQFESAKKTNDESDAIVNEEEAQKEQVIEQHQPAVIAIVQQHSETKPESIVEPMKEEEQEDSSNDDERNDKEKLLLNDANSGTSVVEEGKFGEAEKQQIDEERRSQERLRALQLRAEQEQREREQRKARLAAIMSRTRGTPTAVVAPTQNIITDEGGIHEPLKDVERAPTPNDTTAAPHVLSHTAASVLQKLASSNPRLLSVLQRNGSNPSLADELTAADPSMTLPGQPDEPSSPSHDSTSTAPLRPIDFRTDVSHPTLAMK